MDRFTLFVLITLLKTYICLCQECNLNKRTPEMLAESILEGDLRKCYDLTEPPINSGNRTVPVIMEYILDFFLFDYKDETLILYSWNYYIWKDGRMTWKPEDHSNLNSTLISNLAFWTPGLRLMNNADRLHSDNEIYKITHCDVASTGTVMCIVREEHRVLCTSYLKNWPYDTKTCVLEFGQWRTDEADVIFQLNPISYFSHSYISSGWEIIRIEILKSVKSGVQSTVKFELERLSEGLEASIIVPCFVIATLNVTALLLDYKKDTRLGIASLSFLLHFMVSNVIGIYIPKYGTDIPVVLLFISRSTVLTVIVLSFSLSFKFYAEKSSGPPMWISRLNDFILNSYGRYAIVSYWDDNNDTANKSRGWINFVNIVNSVCLILATIAYICLLVTCIPVKTYSGSFLDSFISYR